MFGFDINDFKSTINKYGGLTRASDFQIIIPHEIGLGLGIDLAGGGFVQQLESIPTRLANLASNPFQIAESISSMSSRDLRFFAEAATIPGVQLQTAEIRHEGYGTFQKRPYQTIMPDVDVTFVEDATAKSLSIFHNWIKRISSFSRTQGNQTFEYPDNYKCDIIILQYDSEGNMIYGVNLLEAYPTTVTPVNLSWTSANEPARFNVSFTYHSWNPIQTLSVFL